MLSKWQLSSLRVTLSEMMELGAQVDMDQKTGSMFLLYNLLVE